ncbi:MAG: exosome complex RNA-binding protein Csl4 [Nitrososphaeria archaeon]|jgi:exosome complex component CSL4
MNILKKKTYYIPGDLVGVIEEFTPSSNVYQENYNIRSKVLGEIKVDQKTRAVSIIPKAPLKGIPKVGDAVVGVVEQSQSGLVMIRIKEINEKPVQSDFMGLIILREQQSDRERRIVIKSSDIVRAKVISLLNNVIHLSIDGEPYGVLRTVCSFCGGQVQQIGRRILCTQCKIVDERKLAVDFGRFKNVETKGQN